MRDYATYERLIDELPPLVRKQRRLEARIVLLVPLSEEEKALRKTIDDLLVDAGILKGDGVTCLGYDVLHQERKGHESLNAEKIVAKLVAGGVDQAFALKVIADSTEVGDPSCWATVKPAKGSKVRA